MSFTKVAPAGIGTEPGTSILIGDSLLHSTGIDIGSNTGIGVTIRKHGDATFTGIITASAFFGDGSGLEGVSSSGIGTPLSDNDTSELNKIYYVNQELSIGSTVTVNHPDSAVASYTHYQDLVVKDDADFIVADGDTFIPDVLGIRTSTSTASAATGGRIRAGTITNAGANGAPNFPNGLTGTAGTFTGNLNVGGVLTYEDVTNIDSVGVVTARSGVRIGTGGTVGPVGSGIVTYFGDGSQLTGISADSTKIETGNTKVETIDTGSDGHVKVTTEGVERLRIASNGYVDIQTGILGDNPSDNFTLNGRTQPHYGFNLVPETGVPIGISGYRGIAFASNGVERLRITSGGQLNLGGSSTQTTHLLHLQSTGDAGIHIRADSDNSGENDNPYLSMSQDGSSAQELKIGQNGDAGQNFPESFGNSPFIHANHSSAYPLQLAHMDNMVVNIAARKNEIALYDYSGNTIAGMEIHHRGNDTGAALKFSGHNNTGTPGVKTFTQFTHLGGDAKFMIHHLGGTAIQIGSTRRIDLPAVYGTAISSPMRDLYVESTGQLGYNPSVRASKINIADNNDVSWLYNLSPKTYNKRKRVSHDTNEWSNEAESDLQYGLIAEEVEPVNSNICFYDVDDSNNKTLAGVTYSQLITPLLKAIQEQKAEIDALKTKVATLEGS